MHLLDHPSPQHLPPPIHSNIHLHVFFYEQAKHQGPGVIRPQKREHEAQVSLAGTSQPVTLLNGQSSGGGCPAHLLQGSPGRVRTEERSASPHGLEPLFIAGPDLGHQLSPTARLSKTNLLSQGSASSSQTWLADCLWPFLLNYKAIERLEIKKKKKKRADRLQKPTKERKLVWLCYNLIKETSQEEVLPQSQRVTIILICVHPVAQPQIHKAKRS
jgi:hypothetical protein